MNAWATSDVAVEDHLRMRFAPAGSARRLVLCVISAAVLSALLATPAIAQNAPSIKPPSAVGPESATLRGIIDTGNSGEGSPCYRFEYDTRSDWAGRQDYVRFSQIVCVRAGSGDVAVTARVGCPRSATCTSAARLVARTRYQATLLVQYQGDGAYYYAEQLGSPQVMFTTQALGSVSLRSSTVSVKGGVAAVRLVCASARACRGRLGVTVAQGANTVRCLTGALSIRAGARATVDAKLTGRCRVLLSAAGDRRLAGRLSVTATTDQTAFTDRRITLVTAR
jgi:hypothetical protein